MILFPPQGPRHRQDGRREGGQGEDPGPVTRPQNYPPQLGQDYTVSSLLIGQHS